MATHSSIFAWEIPWIEEPGGLQSMLSKESDTTQRLSNILLEVCYPGLGGHFCVRPSLGKVLWEGLAPGFVSQGKPCLLGSISPSIHPSIPKEAGASNWLRPQCLTLSLPFLLRAHLRHQPTSFFPFSLDLVETLDSAAQTRAASCPGWAKTPVLRGRPGPRPLRKEAGGGRCLEKQVVWDTPGWSV